MRDDPSMSELVLYDHAGSTNALKVSFLLAELGLEYERIEVPLGAERPPEYREIHPFGLIPALRVGEVLTITESNTALRFLAEHAGRADLRGADPVARAGVDGVLDSLSLEVRPVLWGVEEVAVYGLEVPEEERTRRVGALAEALRSFDALLHPDGPFALGAELTIADAALAGRLLHLPTLPLDAAVAPRTRRSVAAAQARPAFAAARAESPADEDRAAGPS